MTVLGEGFYWLEIDEDGLPTGHACSAYYGGSDKPLDRKREGYKWILVQYAGDDPVEQEEEWNT